MTEGTAKTPLTDALAERLARKVGIGAGCIDPQDATEMLWRHARDMEADHRRLRDMLSGGQHDLMLSEREWRRRAEAAEQALQDERDSRARDKITHDLDLQGDMLEVVSDRLMKAEQAQKAAEERYSQAELRNKIMENTWLREEKLRIAAVDRADQATRELAGVRSALQELVALKDLKDSLIVDFVSLDGEKVFTEESYKNFQEYERRKPLAWAAAREALRALSPLPIQDADKEKE